MARRARQPEERRIEIIKAAKQLFATKGYDDTYISDITDAVGVAHGLFYHYFKSKSELLEALAREWISDYLGQISEISINSSLSVKDKLDLAFNFAFYTSKERSKLIVEIHKQSHKSLHDEISRQAIMYILPLFVELIITGNESGELNCPYPEIAAQTLLYGMASLQPFEDIDLLAESCRQIFHRVLGIS